MNFFKGIKQFKEDYKIPSEGQLPEKTFSYHIIAAALGMLMCVICLASTSWAFFNAGVSSETNNITSSNCFVSSDVVVFEGDSTVEVSVYNGTGIYLLEPGKTYTVYLTAEGTAKSGYCKIIIEGVEYFTSEVEVVGEESDYVYKFTLAVDEGTGDSTITLDDGTVETLDDTLGSVVEMRILSRWGLYSGTADISNDDSFTVGINNENRYALTKLPAESTTPELLGE